MNRILSLFIILSFSLPTYADGVKIDRDLVEDIYSSPSDSALTNIQAKAQNQSCNVKKSVKIFGASQSKLLNFFQNISCDAASKDLLGTALTFDQCKMINENCKSPIPDKETEEIKIELMGYIIRENVRTELNAYHSIESRNLRDLQSYLEKMPDGFKEKIKFCPNYKKVSDSCLNDKKFDKVAKQYITKFYSREDVSSVSRRSSALSAQAQDRVVRAVLNGGEIEGAMAALASSGNLAAWRNDLAQKLEAMRSSRMSEAVQKNNTTEADFTSYIKLDLDWSEKIKADTNSFNPADDKLLDGIVSSVILEANNISPEALKEKVKITFQKFSNDGRDLILSHENKNMNAYIDQAFNDFKINPSDVTASDRKELSKKINNLRVQIANSILADECDKRVASLGQMCEKISGDLKVGKVAGKSLNDSDFFKKISDYYKMNTEPDAVTAKNKSEKFKNMRNAQGKVYNRYINLLFNQNSCVEMFPMLMVGQKDFSSAISDYIKSTENSAIESRNNAYKEIVDIVDKNEVIRNEYAHSGYKFDGMKSLSNSSSSNIEVPKVEAQNTDKVLSNNETLPGIKSGLSENAINPVNNVVNNAPVAKNYDINPVQNPVAEEVKNSDNKDSSANANEELIKKIKSLEKKESSLRKKLDANNSDAQDVAESDELSALRKQIEDLKKENTKNKSDTKVAAAASAGEKATEGKSVPATQASSTLAVRTTASDKETVDSAKMDSSQARQNVSEVADYNQSSQGAAAASKASATSAGAAGAAAKNGTEKGLAGLILTKSGEFAGDPSSILENPNEGDIANFMERTKGEAFIIRENGELVKVSPVLDVKGKPVLASDGKMKFKKVKLSKAQQEMIVKETNVNKAAKEVGVEPVRLFKLKSLLKEVRRD
jgi:hypothetical protein